jgi:HK97 family phage major capsid protein
MSEDIEKVELDASTADTIAEKVAGLLKPSEPDPEIKALREEVDALKALTAKPQRSELDDEPKKAGDDPVFYGGDDKYTSLGETPGEVASTLYLVDQALGIKGGKLSARGREVLIRSAETAIKAGPRKIDTKGWHAPTAAAFKYDLAEYRSQVKAMTSTGANAGDEWVPTFASSELWTDIHLATQIASQIRRVPMPTNPYTLPTLDDDVTFRLAATENVAVTASDLNTGAATLTAKKVQAEVNFSGEVTEDSIIPIAPAIRANLVRRGAQTIDDLIVHGDTETGGTGNINSDDAAPASSSFYLAFNGLRKFALVTNTAQVKQFAGAFTTTLFLNTRALLGKYGARPSDLLFITGVSTTNSIQDVAAWQTLEKYGPNATVLTGEVGRVFNIPVLLSEAVPAAATDKVDDDGKYTTTSVSTNDTDGWFVLVNKTQWTQGFRRDLQIESFRDIQKDMNILVASFRMALIPSGIATTHTAVGYDITVL